MRNLCRNRGGLGGGKRGIVGRDGGRLVGERGDRRGT